MLPIGLHFLKKAKNNVITHPTLRVVLLENGRTFFKGQVIVPIQLAKKRQKIYRIGYAPVFLSLRRVASVSERLMPEKAKDEIS